MKILRKYRWLLSLGILLVLVFPPISATPTQNKLVEEKPSFQISNTIFKTGYSEAESLQLDQIIKAQTRLVTTRKAFTPSLEVVKKHESTIRKVAESKNFPPELALGVALVENGGSETAVSPAGATGIYQLIKPTAHSLGLKVDETTDERLLPERNIEAGVGYLAKNREIFSDPGFAVWAHHAGPQNVSKALKEYSKNKLQNQTLTYIEALEQKKLSETMSNWQAFLSEGLDIHRLLQHESTKSFTVTLKDESSLYPYKVAAATAIFELLKDKSGEEYSKTLEALKQQQVSYIADQSADTP